MGNLPDKAENANTSSFPRKRESSVVRGSATTTFGPRVRGADRGFVIAEWVRSNAEIIAAYNRRVSDMGLWNAGLHTLISGY